MSRFKNVQTSIRSKLIFSLVGTAIAAAVLVSAFAYFSARSALQEAQFDKLTTIREHKASQIEGYMTTVVDQVESLAANPEVVRAMTALDGGWDQVVPGGDVSSQLTSFYSAGLLARLPEGAQEASAYLPGSAVGRHLQGLYLVDNEHPIGSKHLLDAADASPYSVSHQSYHPFFRDYLERFGFYDIFLVEPDNGEIVYSVFKEVDYATSLRSGPYSNTNIADVFRAAMLVSPGESAVVDFAPYTPSYGAPAAFVAAPVFDQGERTGVLIFQLPLDKINGVMTNNASWAESGLGETGEAYIVGPDQKLRTEARRLIEEPKAFLGEIAEGRDEATLANIERLGTAVGLLEVSTLSTEEASEGHSGAQTTAGYRGQEVLSVYRPLDIPGLDWAIISEIDAAEALGPVRSLRNQAVVGTLAVIGFALLIAVFIASAIARPIVAASRSISALARGEAADSRMDSGVGGELGALASAYNDLIDGMDELAERAGRVARGEPAPESGGRSEHHNIANNGVLSDAFASLEETQARLSHQAKLIAKGDLHNPVLQEVIPGELGTAFAEMSANLGLMARQAHAIASGNLVDEALQTQLEGVLGASFVRMVDSLRGLVQEIQSNSASLNQTASQLHESAVSQQLGANEQASAVEETRRILTTLSTSATEIASTTSAVYTNAEVAQQTNNQTADAIRELSGHTARIGEIVSFIKDIANKSDLLALNAALEGTKAGEAGRSFSLVATQMQRLAEQIMGSLKDIDALTEDIRKATRSTVSAVEETARLSTQTTESAGAIAEAIQEQQVSTQQSSTAMDQISAVAQKSVHASTELVDASQQLQALADNFERIVSNFTTDPAASVRRAA